MPSSTSSSRLSLAGLALQRRALVAALVAAAVLVLGIAVALEWRLAARGIAPTAIDSEELWLQERERAAELGDRALVLVGASRIQLGADLDVLRARTGREPVQLAIDGSGIVPVLEDLARDPAITGLVLVDVTDAPLAVQREDAADRHVALYAKREPRSRYTYRWTEERLTRAARRHLRSYADGARPVTSLLVRAFGAHDAPQYLVTLPDRSRLADYRKVRMPAFALERAARDAGLAHPPAGRDAAQVEQRLAAYIGTLRPKDDAAYLRNVERIRVAILAIEARGGRVRLVAMPTSGLTRAAEAALYPRARFWDALAAATGDRAVNSADRPRLAAIPTPDGSHLDYRDRARFTAALVDELDLARP